MQSCHILLRSHDASLSRSCDFLVVILVCAGFAQDLRRIYAWVSRKWSSVNLMFEPHICFRYRIIDSIRDSVCSQWTIYPSILADFLIVLNRLSGFPVSMALVWRFVFCFSVRKHSIVYRLSLSRRTMIRKWSDRAYRSQMLRKILWLRGLSYGRSSSFSFGMLRSLRLLSLSLRWSVVATYTLRLSLDL